MAEHWVAPNGKRYRIDLAYPDLKIAIECDGKLGHLNDAAFESDPKKRNALELDGWLVLHVHLGTHPRRARGGRRRRSARPIALRSG